MQSQNRESIYRQVIEAISRNDASALDQLLAEQLIDHHPIPGQSPGRAGFKEWMASARSSSPDLHGTIEEVLVASGDRVVGQITWHGTQHGPFAGLPPTHRVVALPVILLCASRQRPSWSGGASPISLALSGSWAARWCWHD